MDIIVIFIKRFLNITYSDYNGFLHIIILFKSNFLGICFYWVLFFFACLLLFSGFRCKILWIYFDGVIVFFRLKHFRFLFILFRIIKNEDLDIRHLTINDMKITLSLILRSFNFPNL